MLNNLYLSVREILELLIHGTRESFLTQWNSFNLRYVFAFSPFSCAEVLGRYDEMFYAALGETELSPGEGTWVSLTT